MKEPVRVAITGAAGNIGYALVFRIAAGDMLGPNQPVILQLLEIPPALEALKGVVMEIKDGAYPLLVDATATDQAEEAFKDADYALLVGAKPRGAGMERKDLLQENAKIFAPQGKALNDHANRDVRVLVVGNPANTNALIARSNAPDLDDRQFTAMTRLDHNRALAQLSGESNTPVADIKKMIIWGNHSSTQYPDIAHAEIGGKAATDVIDDGWYKDTFIETVQKRGAAIIKARGASSAASAASSAIDHMRTWALGTAAGDWTSMGVASDGSYGIEPGIVFSYPVTCKDGEYTIVQDLDVSDFSREKINATEAELREEREGIAHLL